MVFQGSSAAISHTGKVRSNNQDSGYSGSNLFVVADGMGGHAGGDVASSLAIDRLQRTDRPFESTAAAEKALRDAIADAANELIDTVHVRPELAGMGTTVSALVMVDDYAVIAHIGDSRIYLYREGTLTQITTDHTFVQRLVDSGRITPEEARYHPRRDRPCRRPRRTGSSPNTRSPGCWSEPCRCARWRRSSPGRPFVRVPATSAARRSSRRP